MTSEFDLPCSVCGDDLREVVLEPRELGIQVETDAAVLVAECQSCSERHYPEQTLADLERNQSR